MKRLHLFEFEDLPNCPRWLRTAITDMLALIHRWFSTADFLQQELTSMLPTGQPTTIIDLCSGSGGPMPEVVQRIRDSVSDDAVAAELKLQLTDLFPNPSTVQAINSNASDHITFHHEPVDATAVDLQIEPARAEVRTMICSFHHMPPEKARAILANAQRDHVPMLIFEMSDNTVPPKWLWWVAILPNFFFGFWVAIFTRPMTPIRFLFSFVVPIIPICFAWEGAVSNIRTYGENDFRELLAPIQSEHYQWTVKSVPGQMINHLVIHGRPIADTR